ncbi:soluble scavenger receptor cysteine-rich domain-containing protein SSC5D-like [Folsomia candida]|uniref:Uncharacterized protein n=1 Tax=Folsomia candida TaxID=158441 RepID=A0A226E8Y2_FOLCA|nr:soluble scavenger receptor cysteine-rich domain-containing protein SSC5D-like [Folsomia candida]OXA53768.1 hypothetical protein Fcan01_10607 [Folsomia candida]
MNGVVGLMALLFATVEGQINQTLVASSTSHPHTTEETLTSSKSHQPIIKSTTPPTILTTTTPQIFTTLPPKLLPQATTIPQNTVKSTSTTIPPLFTTIVQHLVQKMTPFTSPRPTIQSDWPPRIIRTLATTSLPDFLERRATSPSPQNTEGIPHSPIIRAKPSTKKKSGNSANSKATNRKAATNAKASTKKPANNKKKKPGGKKRAPNRGGGQVGGRNNNARNQAGVTLTATVKPKANGGGSQLQVSVKNNQNKGRQPIVVVVVLGDGNKKIVKAKGNVPIKVKQG